MRKNKKVDADIQDGMQRYVERLADIVANKGWAVQSILTNPPVAYTVGLTVKYQIPELAVVGLDPTTATGILNQVAQDLIDRRYVLAENKDYDTVFNGFLARFRPLTVDECKHLRMARLFTPDDTEVQAWQLLWPDPLGNFAEGPRSDSHFAVMQNLNMAMEYEDGDFSH